MRSRAPATATTCTEAADELLFHAYEHRLLCVVRGFLVDCQEWGWIPVRLHPARTLATPRPVLAVLGPDPRVIADATWAKLVWAGLNLLRLRQEIPLNDDELRAVDDGIAAHEALVTKLADVPTPDGLAEQQIKVMT